MYYDALFSEHRAGMVAVCDDIALLSSSPEETQHLLDVVAKYFFERRLYLNTGKTKVVEFRLPNHQGMRTRPSAQYASNPNAPTRESIDTVTSFTYMGTLLDHKLNFDLALTQLNARVKAQAGRLKQMGVSPVGLPLRSKLILWQAYVYSYTRGLIRYLTPKQLDSHMSALQHTLQSALGERVCGRAALMEAGIPDPYALRKIELLNLHAFLLAMPPQLLAIALYSTLTSQEGTIGRATDMANSIRIELRRAQLQEHERQLDLNCPQVFGQFGHSSSPNTDGLPTIVATRVLRNSVLTRIKRSWKSHTMHAVWRQHLAEIQRTQFLPYCEDKWINYLKDHRLDFSHKLFCPPRYWHLLDSPHAQRAFLLHRTGGSWPSSHYSFDHGSRHQYDERVCFHCSSTRNCVDAVEDNSHVLFHCPKFQGSREWYTAELIQLIGSWVSRGSGLPIPPETLVSQLSRHETHHLLWNATMPQSWIGRWKGPSASREAQILHLTAAFLERIRQTQRDYDLDFILSDPAETESASSILFQTRQLQNCQDAS